MSKIDWYPGAIGVPRKDEAPVGTIIVIVLILIFVVSRCSG